MFIKDNKINELNVSSVRYNPKMYIMPCKSLHFSFNININNIEIDFTLKKENNQNYLFSFNINDDTINKEKPNLKTLVETIGTILKNNLK